MHLIVIDLSYVDAVLDPVDAVLDPVDAGFLVEVIRLGL
jgi:hypothetical protein